MIGNVVLLQEFLFKSALKEANITICRPYKINHKTGQNINNGITYPIIFPMERLNSINKLKDDTPKNNSYYFRGLLTDRKNWILDFKNREDSSITFNNNGRNPNLKYEFDVEYYRGMCSSKFVLCPTDVYPWSYRFFEAIMCESIPILDDNELDIFSQQFKFYRKSQNHKYNEEWVKYNTNVFIQKHTFYYET